VGGLLFRVPGEIKDFRPILLLGKLMQKIRRRKLLISIIAIMVTYIVVWNVLCSRWQARFSIDNLRGLTPDEVISRLGPPDLDPRLPEFGGPWKAGDDQKRGALFFDYSAYGWVYSIVFKNNHAYMIASGRK
jgi:hypothetical protein